MPVYNGAEFLHKSIGSVANQTLKDLELICVDDGSSDNSLEVLKDLSDEYDFIKIVTQENQGSGPARNNGIKNACGEYIAFLDADDEFYDDEALERMYYANQDNVEMIAANMVMIDNDDNLVDNFFYQSNDYMFFSEEQFIEPKDYGAPLSFYKNIFNRKFIVENNIYFPSLRRGQDPPFLAKILTLIDKIQAVPVNLYGHHFDVAGGVAVKLNTYDKQKEYIKHFKDTCDILEKGGLKNLADFYKIHMFRFLTWKENIFNPDIFEIFNEIWGINYSSFDKTDFNYTRFIIPAKFYFVLKFDSEEFFSKVNKEFLQINIYDTKAINEIVLNYYLLVILSYSLDDLKSNCDKILNNNLKFKKEFMEYKIRKFLFNLGINSSPVVEQNAKFVISNNPIWKCESLTKNELKTCYKLIDIQ